MFVPRCCLSSCLTDCRSVSASTSSMWLAERRNYILRQYMPASKREMHDFIRASFWLLRRFGVVSAQVAGVGCGVTQSSAPARPWRCGRRGVELKHRKYQSIQPRISHLQSCHDCGSITAIDLSPSPWAPLTSTVICATVIANYDYLLYVR